MVEITVERNDFANVDWPAAPTGAADIAPTGNRNLPENCSNLPPADVFDELRAATVHATATRRTLHPDLSLHDVPLSRFKTSLPS